MTAPTLAALQRQASADEVERLRLVALIDSTTDVLNRAMGRDGRSVKMELDTLAAFAVRALEVGICGECADAGGVTREQLVANEREACAVIAEKYVAGYAFDIAAAIRARGDTP